MAFETVLAKRKNRNGYPRDCSAILTNPGYGLGKFKDDTWRLEKAVRHLKTNH